jgi:hypothetical protein
MAAEKKLKADNFPTEDGQKVFEQEVRNLTS